MHFTMSLGRAKWQLNFEWRLKSRTKRARNARQGVQQVPGWQARSLPHALPHALPLSQQSSLSLSAALRSLFAYIRRHPVESHVAVALVQLGDTLVASEIATNLLHTKRGTRRYSAFGIRQSAFGCRHSCAIVRLARVRAAAIAVIVQPSIRTVRLGSSAAIAVSAVDALCRQRIALVRLECVRVCVCVP